MAMNQGTPRISVILHDIRSAENVGAIFRTSDAAGVQKLYLTGYTPAPLDRFGRPNSKVAKAALGAELSVSWEACKSPNALIKRLKKQHVKVVAAEQSPRATPYAKWKSAFPVAILFGNEVSGVSPALLKQCDEVVEIPMHGKKESLNVSVAAGVILFKAAESLTG